MVTTVLVSIASTFLILLGGVGAWALVVSGKRAAQSAPKHHETGYLEELAARIAAVELVVKGLPSLWEEERERMLQHANRAQTAERRVTKLLEEGEEDELDPDEEDARVRSLDAYRSEYGELQPVQDRQPMQPSVLQRCVSSKWPGETAMRLLSSRLRNRCATTR